MKSKFLFLVLLLWLSCSCQDKGINKHLNELSKLYPCLYLDYKNVDWTLERYKLIDETSYVAIGRSKDTLLTLVFYKGIKSEKYFISFLEKTYKIDSTKHIIRFGADTMYHYTTNFYTNIDTFFLSGKYLYQYQNNLLSLEQEYFFQQNRDSLQLIKGNDLEPLKSIVLPDSVKNIVEPKPLKGE